MDFKFSAKTKFTKLLEANSIQDWSTLKMFVQKLPYGRNTARDNFSLVLTEKKGTCSSKHALLAQIAQVYNIPNIDLILGMFKMNESNFPQVKSILLHENLKFIPEAHCYISESGNRLDLTSKNASINNIANDILTEQIISPAQVISYKVKFHQDYLKNWIKKEGIKKSFEEIWKIREACIAALSNNEL